MSFRYEGIIPASKSILNRLLILQSFAPQLIIERGDSSADDVIKMRTGLISLMAGVPADCGAAGTTLRFLALRASRIPGRHRLLGTRKLFSRPQEEIIKVLAQLGCHAEQSTNELLVSGDGWKINSAGLQVDRSISSQFASAIILSSWNLDAPLILHFSGDAVSEGYLQMTLEIVKRAGLEWHQPNAVSVQLPAAAQIKAQTLEAESDLSSAFAIAALAAIDGEAKFVKWPLESLQPDSIFPDILKRMGAAFSLTRNVMKIERAPSLRGITQDLRDVPDLFPVLSVLCAVAKGKSVLRGAPHLVHKESSRIEKSAELVMKMGAAVEVGTDGMTIHGGTTTSTAFSFDPEHDHRLAMAAGVARQAGHKIEILNPQVVDKSFPEFWKILSEGNAR